MTYYLGEVAPTNYTVTFNMNGHGTQIKAQTVVKGNKLVKPEDPKDSGYIFEGWFVDEKCLTKFDFNSPNILKVQIQK